MHKLRAVPYLKHRHREEADAVAVDLDLSFDCDEVAKGRHVYVGWLPWAVPDSIMYVATSHVSPCVG